MKGEGFTRYRGVVHDTKAERFNFTAYKETESEAEKAAFDRIDFLDRYTHEPGRFVFEGIETSGPWEKDPMHRQGIDI